MKEQPRRQTAASVAMEIIKTWEGLELQPYKSQEDDGWTIGWGHRMTAAERKKYADGITEDQAQSLLLGDMMRAARTVETKVGPPLNINQEGALISLVFNIGSGAFARSTVLKLVNQARHDEVPAAIKMWDKVTVNGRKIVSRGLQQRRKHEAFVYSRPVAPQPKPLTRSRTLAGSLATGTATAAGGGIEAAQEALGEVQGQLSDLALYLDIAKWLLIAVALAGLGLVIYARLSDRKDGHR